MDRNISALHLAVSCIVSLSARRAWIEIKKNVYYLLRDVSLSARRAWIEIEFERINEDAKNVALRKESVDRNLGRLFQGPPGLRSLSARRAWIEISRYPPSMVSPSSRSPQGERG